MPVGLVLVIGCGDAPEPQSDPTPQGSDWTEAVESLSLRHRLEPHQPYWPFALGQLYFAADRPDSGEIWLRRSMDTDPAYLPAITLLSREYYESGSHADGIELLEATRLFWETDSHAAEAAAGLALHYVALGDHEAAVANCEPCPPSLRTYLTLRGSNYRQAKPTAGDAPADLNNRGIQSLHVGDVTAAETLFLEAHAADPQLPGPLYNLALIERFYRMDKESARAWFAQYRLLSSDDPDDLESALNAEENAP